MKLQDISTQIIGMEIEEDGEKKILYSIFYRFPVGEDKTPKACTFEVASLRVEDLVDLILGMADAYTKQPEISVWNKDSGTGYNIPNPVYKGKE